MSVSLSFFNNLFCIRGHLSWGLASIILIKTVDNGSMNTHTVGICTIQVIYVDSSTYNAFTCDASSQVSMSGENCLPSVDTSAHLPPTQ